MIDSILENVDPESKARIEEILESQKKKFSSYSETNKDRKSRLINCFFDNNFQFKVHIQVLRGVLRVFEPYTKLFQTEKPMSHAIHTELFSFATKFLSCFMKTEEIPESAKKLKKLNLRKIPTDTETKTTKSKTTKTKKKEDFDLTKQVKNR